MVSLDHRVPISAWFRAVLSMVPMNQALFLLLLQKLHPSEMGWESCSWAWTLGVPVLYWGQRCACPASGEEQAWPWAAVLGPMWFLLLGIAVERGPSHTKGVLTWPLYFAACLLILLCYSGMSQISQVGFDTLTATVKKITGTRFILPLTWPFFSLSACPIGIETTFLLLWK